MTERGLSERRALTVIGMSASALRYKPAPDRNVALRARIVALAHRYRRYGAGMIHLKLQQAGEAVNAKRVHRLYVEARLQIRRRRRKKVPVVDRQPLVKPEAANDVWSADFVFDRTAEGRVLKCLTIVDDATTEAVAIIPARALGGPAVTRVLDRLGATRGADATDSIADVTALSGRSSVHRRDGEGSANYSGWQRWLPSSVIARFTVRDFRRPWVKSRRPPGSRCCGSLQSAILGADPGLARPAPFLLHRP